MRALRAIDRVGYLKSVSSLSIYGYIQCVPGECFVQHQNAVVLQPTIASSINAYLAGASATEVVRADMAFSLALRWHFRISITHAVINAVREALLGTLWFGFLSVRCYSPLSPS